MTFRSKGAGSDEQSGWMVQRGVMKNFMIAADVSPSATIAAVHFGTAWIAQMMNTTNTIFFPRDIALRRSSSSRRESSSVESFKPSSSVKAAGGPVLSPLFEQA